MIPPPQRHGPQIPQQRVPLLGQQQAQQQQALMQIVQQTSLGIYVDVVAGVIASREPHQELDRERLQQLARDSMTAAQSYFQGLGVATFTDKGPQSPPEDNGQ